MSTQIDFPRLNIVVADEETAVPIEGASVQVEVGRETDEEKTVVNESWEGVAAFKIAPTYESVKVTVSHDLFEEEVTEVDISRDVTTEVFELSSRTAEVTISPPKTIEQELDMEIRPVDQRIQSIWDVDVCEITVFPDLDEVIVLPPGEYLLKVRPVDGDQLVRTPSNTFEVEPESPVTLDFQAPDVDTLPEPQLDQLDELSHRIDELTMATGGGGGEPDSAVPNYLLSVARLLIEDLQVELDYGLPKRLRGEPIEEITVTYIEALSHVLAEIRAPLFEGEMDDLYRVASKLDPVNTEWKGPASFDELQTHLMKTPTEAVNDLEEIRANIGRELDTVESDLAHSELLRDLLEVLNAPETDDSLELITSLYVVSRFWLAIDDILKDDDLRKRFDVMATEDRPDELELNNPERFDESEDDDLEEDPDAGFFDRF